MCKPGSASGGSGVTSSGLGLAFAVVGIAGLVSMASAFVGTIITAAVIAVFSLAAAGTVLLVVILWRTRSVVTWPMRTTPPPGAAPRPACTVVAQPRPGPAGRRRGSPARRPGAPAAGHRGAGVRPGGDRGARRPR
jgi:hypothetical protein